MQLGGAGVGVAVGETTGVGGGVGTGVGPATTVGAEVAEAIGLGKVGKVTTALGQSTHVASGGQTSAGLLEIMRRVNPQRKTNAAEAAMTEIVFCIFLLIGVLVSHDVGDVVSVFGHVERNAVRQS